MDQWGNYHSEIKLPRNDIITEIHFGGGYGHDSWGVSHYLLNTGEIIVSQSTGPESGCKVYRDEIVRIKSIVMNLWAEKSHPKVYIYDMEQFRQKYPLTYKVVKYLYCVKDLSWLSVVSYDKKYNTICSD